ncbi:MAG: hypothetical protein ACNA8W_12775 [Bradymonadaceae bacterium]
MSEDSIAEAREIEDEYASPKERMARWLRRSDLDFGTLYFDQPMGKGNYPEVLVDPPSFMKDGWVWVDEIDLVIHPVWGALVLGYCDRLEDFKEEIERVQALAEKLRIFIANDPIWSAHPHVMDVAMIIFDDEWAALGGMEAQITIWQDQFDEIEGRLEKIFELHGRNLDPINPQHAMNFARRMRTMHGFMGGFSESESWFYEH